jgi:NitT/TauT family transport system substrate-binding protein
MKHYLLAFAATIFVSAANAALIPITLATPGPGNLLHLPIDLIPRIGADKAEGAQLTIRYFGGGPVAYRDMIERNSDFSVAGIAALADFKAHGAAVQSVAAVTTTGAYVMLVRSGLEDKIKTLADLKGRVIGVNSSSTKSKSTSQMTAEYLLTRNGVSLSSVHFIAAGQSFADQSAALLSESIDALMGDEPFASKLIAQRSAYNLVNLMNQAEANKWLGGNLLNAQLCSRQETIEKNPELTALMIRILKRSLEYISSHSSEEIATQLGVQGDEKDRLTSLLNQYKDSYSKTGAFSAQELNNTQTFFRSVNANDAQANQFNFNTLINNTWVGSTP